MKRLNTSTAIAALLVLVGGGVWFYLNHNSQEKEDPAAVPQAPFTSPLLEGLSACGPVYSISLFDTKFYFTKSGKWIEDGKVGLNDFVLMGGDANINGVTTIDISEGHLKGIEYVMMRFPELKINFTGYNSIGLPISAVLEDSYNEQSYELKIKCTDFDAYGNWTRMLIEAPEAEESDYILSYCPSEISRTIEYWSDDTPDLVAFPTDSELELLLKLANKVDKTALTKEFYNLRDQATDAPVNVWGGGFTDYDLNNELLFGGEETPTEFHITYLNRHNSDDLTNFWAYVTLEEIYDGGFTNSSSYLVYFVLEDGQWKISDIDDRPANEYMGEHSMADDMREFIKKANEELISGKTEQDVREEFSFDPEGMQSLLNKISNYKNKYNIE